MIPFDNAAGDLLGNAVALSGDYALVGAYGKESFQGAAYVFSRNEGGPDNWGEVQKLTGDNRHFGCSLALSGNSALVGQQHFIFGAALVFDKDEGGIDNWGRVKKITVADGGATKFGMHVAISGDFALIGAHQDNDIAPMPAQVTSFPATREGQIIGAS